MPRKPKRPVKTHTFDGKKYEVFIGDVDGHCARPNSPKGEIYIKESLPPKQFLETAIHEAMHAINWHIPEEVIDKRAKELTHFLWRLGYRRS